MTAGVWRELSEGVSVFVAVISVGVEEERELQTFDSVRNVCIKYHKHLSNIAQ